MHNSPIRHCQEMQRKLFLWIKPPGGASVKSKAGRRSAQCQGSDDSLMHIHIDLLDFKRHSLDETMQRS